MVLPENVDRAMQASIFPLLYLSRVLDSSHIRRATREIQDHMASVLVFSLQAPIGAKIPSSKDASPCTTHLAHRIGFPHFFPLASYAKQGWMKVGDFSPEKRVLCAVQEEGLVGGQDQLAREGQGQRLERG